MRLFVALGCLVLAGCTGSRATGELWAQRLVDEETLLFRLSDAQRADRVRSFELSLVDETLSTERLRVQTGLSGCPGPDRRPISPSPGDRPRDTVRIQANVDAGRMTSLAQIALADWYVRRGGATGDAQFCDAARTALTSSVSPADGGALADVLKGLGTATVSRDPAQPAADAGAESVNTSLSSYVLGYVDTIEARAPLPQYLAAVYGGTLLATARAPDLHGATPESLVDRFARAYPDWEPDALYAALQ